MHNSASKEFPLNSYSMEQSADRLSHSYPHSNADEENLSNADCAEGYRSTELTIMHAALMDLAQSGLCTLPQPGSLSQENLMHYYKMYFQPSIKIERIDKVIFNHTQNSSSDSACDSESDSLNGDKSSDTEQTLPVARYSTQNITLDSPFPMGLQQSTTMETDAADGQVSRLSTVRQFLSQAIDSGQTQTGLTQLSYKVKLSTKETALVSKARETVLERTRRILEKCISNRCKKRRKRSGHRRDSGMIASVNSKIKLENSKLITNMQNMGASNFPTTQDDKHDKLQHKLQNRVRRPSKPRTPPNVHSSTSTKHTPGNACMRKISNNNPENGLSNDGSILSISVQSQAIAQKETEPESGNENELTNPLQTERQSINSRRDAHGDGDVISPSSDSLRLALDLPGHNWLENKYQMRQTNIKFPAIMPNNLHNKHAKDNEREMNNNNFAALSSTSIHKPGPPVTSSPAIMCINDFPSYSGIGSTTVSPHSPINTSHVSKPTHIDDDNTHPNGDWSRCQTTCTSVHSSKPHDAVTVDEPTQIRNCSGGSIIPSNSISTQRISPADVSPLAYNGDVYTVQDKCIVPHHAAASMTTDYTAEVNQHISQQSSSIDKDLSVQSSDCSGSGQTQQLYRLKRSVPYATVAPGAKRPADDTPVEAEQLQNGTVSPRPSISSPPPVLLKRKQVDAIMPLRKRSKVEGKDHSSFSGNISDNFDQYNSGDHCNPNIAKPSSEQRSTDTSHASSLLEEKSHICSSSGKVIDEVLTVVNKQEEATGVFQPGDLTPVPALGILKAMSSLSDTCPKSEEEDNIHAELSTTCFMLNGASKKTTEHDNQMKQSDEAKQTEVINSYSIMTKTSDAKGEESNQNVKIFDQVAGNVSESLTHMLEIDGTISDSNNKVRTVVQSNYIEGAEDHDEAMPMQALECVMTDLKAHTSANSTMNASDCPTATGERGGYKNNDAHQSLDLCPASQAYASACSIEMVPLPTDESAIVEQSPVDNEDLKCKVSEWKTDHDTQALTTDHDTESNKDEVTQINLQDCHDSTVTMLDTKGTNASPDVRPTMNVQPNIGSTGDTCNTNSQRYSCSLAVSIELQTLQKKVLDQERELKMLIMLSKMKEKEKQIICNRIKKVQSEIIDMKSTLNEQTDTVDGIDFIDLTADRESHSDQVDHQLSTYPHVLSLATSSMKVGSESNQPAPSEIETSFPLTQKPSTNPSEEEQARAQTSLMMSFDDRREPSMSDTCGAAEQINPCYTHPNDQQEHMQPRQLMSQPDMTSVQPSNEGSGSQPKAKQTAQRNTTQSQVVFDLKTISHLDLNSGAKLKSAHCTKSAMETNVMPSPTPANPVEKNSENPSSSQSVIHRNICPAEAEGRNARQSCISVTCAAGYETHTHQNHLKERIQPMTSASQPVLKPALPIDRGPGSKRKHKKITKRNTKQPVDTLHSCNVGNHSVSNLSHQTTTKANGTNAYSAPCAIRPRLWTNVDSFSSTAPRQYSVNAMTTSARHISAPLITHQSSCLQIASGLYPRPNVAVSSSHSGVHEPRGKQFQPNDNACTTLLQPGMFQRTHNPRSHNASKCLTSAQLYANREVGHRSNLLKRNFRPIKTLPAIHHEQVRYPVSSLVMPTSQYIEPRTIPYPLHRQNAQVRNVVQQPCEILEETMPVNLSRLTNNPPSYTETVKSMSTRAVTHGATQPANNGQIPPSNMCRSDTQFKPATSNVGLYMQCCLCRAPAAFLCSGCSAAPYCTSNCQRMDWAVHRRQCIKRYTLI